MPMKVNNPLQVKEKAGKSIIVRQKRTGVTKVMQVDQDGIVRTATGLEISADSYEPL